MKVHVVCHGLFGILLAGREAKENGHPENCCETADEAVFLDAAGWNAKDFHIPPHDLFLRFSDGRGQFASRRLGRRTELRIAGAPEGRTRVLSRPVRLADVLGERSSALRPACGVPGTPGADAAQCLLGGSPLIRARLKLGGGTLRNCEFHPLNGIDFSERRSSWGSQHLDYQWQVPDGGGLFVSKTSNAVLYSFDTGDSHPQLVIGEECLPLGEVSPAARTRLPALADLGAPGEGFALVTLNNTVPKSVVDQGHFHLEPNRDTHSLLFHELLAAPLPVEQRPIPQLRYLAAAGAEAPPLTRCIPYSY